MANLSLVFDVLVKDGASKGFTDIGNAAERSGKKAETGLASITNAAKLAGGALLGAGIITGFRELYDAAAESQRITRLTESAIRSTGGAAKISADQVGDLAAAISAKTGIDDEAIQSGQNLLLTFTNIRNEAGAGNAIFDRTSEILADMSTVLGTDAAGSAVQLGKALNDPIAGLSSLSRAGVQFTDQQKEQIRTLVESGDTLGAQRVILDELTTQFGGAAEAAATPLDKMRVSIGNVVEALGSNLIPVVDDFATGAVTAIEGVSAGFESGEVTADGFEGAMQGVGVAVADLADGVGVVIDSGKGLLDVLNAIPGPVVAGAGAIAGFSLLKGPVGDALDTIALKGLYARDGLAAAGGGMGVLKSGASGLVGILGGPVGIALAGAAAGLAILTSAQEDNDAATEANQSAQKRFADAIREAGGAIDDSVRSSAAAEAQSTGLLDVTDQAGISAALVTDALTGNAAAYDQVRDSLLAYQEANTTRRESNLGVTSESLNSNAEAAQGAATSLETLAAALPATREEMEQLGRATESTDTALGATAPTAETFTESMEGVRQGVSDAKKAVDDYKLSLDILTGANVSLIDVQSSYFDSLEFSAESLAGLEGAVADANGALNLQTEAGRFASDTLLGIRDSGNQLISTMIEQGSTSDEVRAQDAQLRQSFIDTAEQMGFSEGSALDLANQILGIPEERETTITADTTGAAANVAGLQNLIDGLRGRTISVDVVGSATARALVQQGNPNAAISSQGGFWEGGYTGPGGKFKPAGTVHAGEVVFSQADVAAHGGVSAVEAMRVSRRGYAEGGIVRNIEVSINDAGVSDTIAGMRALEPATGLVAALQYAKSQVGKPYVWGSAGPGGFDCSGFMSAITNVARGKSPNSRLGSTATFPWAGFAGGDGQFTIGSTPNASGGIGHMAGTLLGVNVESRGGQGVVVGNSARGARNSIFMERAHLATFDSGGDLQPGYTLAFNGTGKPERIRTAEQEAALLPPQITVEARVFVGDREITDIARVEATTVVNSAVRNLDRTLSGRGVR